MANKTERQRAIDRADEWVSKYIRLLYSHDGIVGKCHTCPAVLPIKELQAGHGIGGRGLGIRWEVKIIRPQCPKCNRQGEGGLSGNYEVFIPWIIDIYGREEYDRLFLLSKSVVKMQACEIREVADKFRIKYNELKFRMDCN